MDFINQFFKQLQNVFKKLNPTQRFIVFIVSRQTILSGAVGPFKILITAINTLKKRRTKTII